MGASVIIRFRHEGVGWCAPVGVHDDDDVRGLLRRFFADVAKQCQDTRFNDPRGLAAKFIVWMAADYTRAWGRTPLDFSALYVSPVADGDINWDVICHHGPPSKRRPTVRVLTTNGKKG